MVGSQGIEAGKAFIRLGLEDETKKALAGVRGRLQKFARGVGKIADSVMKMGASIAAPLALATRSFMKQGDQIDKISKRTKLSTDAVQSLGFAFEQSGADANAMEAAVRGLNRNLVDLDRGLSTAKDNFDDLGLSADDFAGLDTEARFKLIVKRLGGISDEGRKAGIAMKIFGRSGTSILPLIGHIDSLQSEFERLGVKLDGDTVKNAADVTDEFNRLRLSFMKMAAEIGNALSGDLQEFSAWVRDSIIKGAKWVKANKDWIITVAKVAAGLLAVGVALKGVSLAAAGISALFTPWGVFAVKVAAVVAALKAGIYVGNQLNKVLGNTYENWTKVGGAFGPSEKDTIGDKGTGSDKGTAAAVKRINEKLRKDIQKQIDAGVNVESNTKALANLNGAKSFKDQQKAKEDEEAKANAKMERGKLGKGIPEAVGKTVKKGLNDFLINPLREFKNTVMIDVAELRKAGIEKARENRKERERKRLVEGAKQFEQELTARASSQMAFGTSALALQSGGPGREVFIQESMLEALRSIDGKMDGGGIQ